VEIARPGTAAERITHELFVVRREDKLRLLDRLVGEYRGTVLVFSRTKHGAKRITRAVRGMKVSVAEIHANRSLNQRREALDGFKSGRYRVLVATDIAARGIDVTGIELVVNFDLPEHPDDYVHRVGRTGRAGHAGHAVSFATPDQGQLVRSIERLIQARLPVSRLPDLPPARSPSTTSAAPPPRRGGRPWGGQRRRRPRR
jgi:ATP-dependent RNA helicase RhlE